MKVKSLEEMIQEWVKKQQHHQVSIGYFEDEGLEPSYDEANTCPFCNESLVDSSKPIKVIRIHCTKFPLATFVRFHQEELTGMMELKYHEVIADALEERSRIDQERKKVPEVFKNAFK